MRMKMSKLIKDKVFLLGFFSKIFLFLSLKYLNFTREKFTCDDCRYQYGFPFYLYEEGGFVTVERFIWSGLFFDIVIALICSFLIGLIFKFVWAKISANKLK